MYEIKSEMLVHYHTKADHFPVPAHAKVFNLSTIIIFFIY